MKPAIPVFTALTLCLACATARAEVLSSITGGELIAMPLINYQGNAPQTFGTPQITWTTTEGASVFGWDASGITFGGTIQTPSNGDWLSAFEANHPSAYTNSGVGSMTFTFSVPVYQVGGFVNYDETQGASAGIPTLAVFDSSGNLLEQTTLNWATNTDNSGYFVGFSETTAIGSFKLTNADIGITDLTTASQPASDVPEPASAAILGLAFAALLGVRRRRNA